MHVWGFWTDFGDLIFSDEVLGQGLGGNRTPASFALLRQPAYVGKQLALAHRNESTPLLFAKLHVRGPLQRARTSRTRTPCNAAALSIGAHDYSKLISSISRRHAGLSLRVPVHTSAYGSGRRCILVLRSRAAWCQLCRGQSGMRRKAGGRVNFNFGTTAASKSVGGHSNRVSSVARHAEASSAWH
jgi:hypothetical protein